MDPYASPPSDMKDLFKKYQKVKLIDQFDKNLIDFGASSQVPEKAVLQSSLQSHQLLPIFQNFAKKDCDLSAAEDAAVYTVEALPGRPSNSYI